MALLDLSSVNVALLNIAGNFGATQHESTWILTSFILGNAVILPLTDWLAIHFGRKAFYMACVAVFTASSLFCGLAPTFASLVLFRTLQGLSSGGLQAIEQAILADVFPPKKRGMAFALYGMAIVVAPAFGPTLGGFVTNNYGWRWLFQMNVPLGLMSIALTSWLVEDPPYLDRLRTERRATGIDVPGLALISLSAGCLQFAFERGQDLDWFSSDLIVVLLVTAVSAAITWFVWEWRHRDPVVQVRLFRRPHFTAVMIVTFATNALIVGATFIFPEFLQNLLGYPAIIAGKAMMSGGLVIALAMPLAGAIVGRIDPRGMLVAGLIISAIGFYYISTHLTLTTDFTTACVMRALQMAGVALIFVPASTLAYRGVPKEWNGQVSTIFNLADYLGSSLGLTLVSTYVVRAERAREAYLINHVDRHEPLVLRLLGKLGALPHSYLGPSMGVHRPLARLALLVRDQAVTLAYSDVMSAMALVGVCLIPLALFIRTGNDPPSGLQIG